MANIVKVSPTYAPGSTSGAPTRSTASELISEDESRNEFVLHYVKSAYEDLERQKTEQWREWAIMESANRPHWFGAQPGAKAYETERRSIAAERTRREAAKWRPGWMWSWEVAAEDAPAPVVRSSTESDDKFRRQLVGKALELWESQQWETLPDGTKQRAFAF